jgi:hypothetical protein
MKIMLIFSLFSISLLATLPAHAGAASGMPSSFFPPYSDYGCDARCIVRHDPAFHCRLVGESRLTHHGAARCRTVN